MPYIPEEDREAALDMFKDAGDFAFKLTDDILEHLYQVQSSEFDPKHPDGWKKNLAFKDFALAVGVLEATKLELWRRMIVPHENKKCTENGDVYKKD
jgi:hypothetical protein